MENKLIIKIYLCLSLVIIFLFQKNNLYATNQDIIAMERIYFLKNINMIQMSYGGPYTGLFNYGLGLRKGSGNFHIVAEGTGKDFSFDYFALTGMFYVTGCWFWPDESYNPYAKDTSYAGRLGTAWTAISPIGNFRAGFYWQNWAISKHLQIYEQYKNNAVKQWDFNYYFTYSINKEYFDLTTIYSEIYKRLEPGIKYFKNFRSAIYFVNINDKFNSENSANIYGLHQEIIIDDSKENSRYILLDVSRTEPDKVSNRTYQIDKYSYRLESYGVIPYLYAGIWYNKEFGLGYGGGIGLWRSRGTMMGQEIELIFKWNEIQTDPIFGRSEGLTIDLRASSIF